MTTLTPYLVQPNEAFADTFLAAMREHQEVDGAPDAGGLTLTDLQAGDCLTHYTAGLRDGTALRRGTGDLQGCEWWLVEPDDDGLAYIGRVSLRLYPSRRHGHIECTVRPSRRRQGHGARLLTLGLDIARERGITTARLVCSEGDQAARRLIESAGGTLTGIEFGRCQYRIPRT